MNREVKKRRKRFWAMCLAALLMFGSLPMEALAANCQLNDITVSGNVPTEDTIVSPSDTFSFKYTRYYTESIAAIIYYDADGTTVLSSEGDSTDAWGTDNSTIVRTVEEYTGKQIEPNRFKGWKITYLRISSGYFGKMKLTAVEAAEYPITYVYNACGEGCGGGG